VEYEAVPKIQNVILCEAKNLLFFFLIKKSKDEILRPPPQDDTER
jgi:hypothetical protein